MEKKNLELRKIAERNGVKLWMIANKLGISESTLIRHLRIDLSSEEKDAVIKAINSIIEENNNV